MDTPIAPGNSGGPLVDLNGKVVGINTRGIQGQSLNFAIPINTAKAVAAEILRTATPDKKGQVDRVGSGHRLSSRFRTWRAFYDIDINKGVLINSVDRGSPAAKAGVKTQDILLGHQRQADATCAFPKKSRRCNKMIADLPIGQDVALTHPPRQGNAHSHRQDAKARRRRRRRARIEGLGPVRARRDAHVRERRTARRRHRRGRHDAEHRLPRRQSRPALRRCHPHRQQKPATDLDEFVRLYDESVKTRTRACCWKSSVAAGDARRC